MPSLTLYRQPRIRLEMNSYRQLAKMLARLGPILWQGNRIRRLSPAVQPSALSNLARAFTQALEINLELRGLEHAHGGPFVVVSLHESFADALALFHLPLPLHFTARDELLNWPWLGSMLRDTGQIRLDPENPQRSYRQLVRQSLPILTRGESVMVFAQGSVCGLEIDFQPGAFALAARTGVPILPVMVSGGHQVWDHPFSSKLQLGAHMTLQALEPIKVTNVQTARVQIKRQLKALALQEPLAKPRRFDPNRDGFWDGYMLEIDPDYSLYEQMRQHRLKYGLLPDGRKHAVD